MAFAQSIPDIVAASMQPAFNVHCVQSPARYRFGKWAGSWTGRRYLELFVTDRT